MNKRIKTIRENLGMTQDAFAESIGIKRNSLSLIELGKRNPGDRTISDICEKFNINEEWLRTGNGNIESDKPKGILRQLAEEFSLNSDDLALLVNYLRLEKTERAVVANYVQNVAEDMKRSLSFDERPAPKRFEDMTPEEITETIREDREIEKREEDELGRSSSTA